MKKKQWIIYAVTIVLLLLFAAWVRGHVPFEWSVFRDQLRHVDWPRIGAAVSLLWAAYGLRAVRWSILIRPQKRAGWFSLIGTQVIGFTAVALFGRLADLVRPYLVARRLQLSLSSQIAVYTLERMFDLGATALLFSSALLLAPDRRSLPHHEAFQRSALLALGATIALGLFAIAVRLSGKAVAGIVERTIGFLSPALGGSVAAKILAFREGLDSIRKWRDFLWALGVSLLMWSLIAGAYLETVHSFVLSPQLQSMTAARCLVLMAASMVVSVVQLPVLGWFTQIAFTAGVMRSLFNVQSEPALGCAAVLLIVTFLSVIPLGLIWARIEHVSLKQISEESEHLAEAEAGEAFSSAAP